MKIEFECVNDGIRLSDEIRCHISKKLYRKIKSTDTIILVNDKPLEAWRNIKKGDFVQIEISDEGSEDWPLIEANLDVAYEDENYLIVWKSENLLTIPTKAEPISLFQQVAYYLKNNNDSTKISILNRLDKETRGLVVIAKNRLAAYYLQPTHEHMVRKYEALCEGVFENQNGKIETFIIKDTNSNRRMVSNGEGKKAITNYHVIKQFNDYALVEFVLETGRTHQIRVHSSHINHPIIGDKMYGNGQNGDDLYLASCYVEFINPFTKEAVCVKRESGWLNGRTTNNQ